MVVRLIQVPQYITATQVNPETLAGQYFDMLRIHDLLILTFSVRWLLSSRDHNRIKIRARQGLSCANSFCLTTLCYFYVVNGALVAKINICAKLRLCSPVFGYCGTLFSFPIYKDKQVHQSIQFINAFFFE